MMATSSSRGSSSLATRKKKGKDGINLETTIRNMKLKEYELDVIFVREGGNFRTLECRKVVGRTRVNTIKPFSMDAFKDIMRSMHCGSPMIRNSARWMTICSWCNTFAYEIATG